MTKERKAQILTVLVLAAGLAAAVYKRGMFERKPDPSPQDTIYAMLDAAREGSVDKFLAVYAGSLQRSLRQSVTPQYLRDLNAPIKGVALNEPAVLNDREVKVRVEYVYQDRNEAQVFYLEKFGADWKITRVENSERVKTLIPYGTPVK